jgi:hypothetical protein
MSIFASQNPFPLIFGISYKIPSIPQNLSNSIESTRVDSEKNFAFASFLSIFAKTRNGQPYPFAQKPADPLYTIEIALAILTCLNTSPCIFPVISGKIRRQKS